MAIIAIEKLGAHLTGQLEAVVKDAKKEILKEAVRATPVQTGRLRGGWVPSDGTPTADSPDRKDKTGAEVEKEIDAVVDASDAASTTFLSNNESYAGIVDAREGMVNAAASSAQAAFAKAARNNT